MRTAVPVQNLLLSSLSSFIDGPTGNGTIEIYDAAPAGSAGSVPPGNLLGILTFGRPSFQNPSGGYMDSYSITSEVNARTDGTMAGFIIKNSSGTILLDGTIGDIGSEEDLEFDDIEISEGDPIILTNLRITF